MNPSSQTGESSRLSLSLDSGQSLAIKDDLVSMEHSIFCLSKKGDTNVREWRRGGKFARIIPSGEGAATIYDKDLLLYVASQIVEAKNRGLPISRTVDVDSNSFLAWAARGDGRASFERIVGTLRRLRGTTIETNIPTGGLVQTEGFSLIDGYLITGERTRSTSHVTGRGKIEPRNIQRAISFRVTISEWLYNALLNFEVLTIHEGYFQLSRPIDRRLYALARKHCGAKALWKINIDLLADKVGTRQQRFKFRDELRKTIKSDVLPEYRMALDTVAKPDDVVFYTRDAYRLSKELRDSNLYGWFSGLERYAPAP